jgi:serpin B
VNGIWSKSLKESYISIIENIHKAEANELPKSYDPIDQYITKKTNGLVTNMLSGDIDPLVVAVLVNAVHFKGDWTIQFDKKETYRGEYITSSGNKREAMFMFAKRKMKFAANASLLNGASIVHLDYGKLNEETDQPGSDFAALFILPEQLGREGLNGVIDQLAALNTDSSSNVHDTFDDMLRQMSSHQKVELSLPRFKMEYGTKSLKNELRGLGLGACFDGTDVLMEMSDDPLVHVDEVFHKTVIEVTEEGTEAAAATVAIVMSRSLPLPTPVPKIKFNRPFIMVILHSSTNTPLFVAKVDDPELYF